MLPMGTIMASSMLLAVLFALDLRGHNFLQKVPKMIRYIIASLVMLSGLWNVLWYASQHLGEFWGNSALISGCLMIITSLYLFGWRKNISIIWKLKPFVLLLLFAFFILYSYTIYHL